MGQRVLDLCPIVAIYSLLREFELVELNGVINNCCIVLHLYFGAETTMYQSSIHLHHLEISSVQKLKLK